MFSDNGMISSRQLKRQMVLSFLGVLLLLGTGEAAGGGTGSSLPVFGCPGRKPPHFLDSGVLYPLFSPASIAFPGFRGIFRAVHRQ